MSELILQLSEQSPNLNLTEIIMILVTAAALSFAIYISYWYTHVGTAYSRKFNISLVMLAILTATVMSVIGNNVALSLGMVGALSIVRFRTAIKDSRDTTYIFWAIMVGIACGAGAYLVAMMGSIMVFVILLAFGRVSSNHRLLLIIKAKRISELEVEGSVFQQFDKKAYLRVKNTTEENVEWIYELSRQAYQKEEKKEQSITDLLYEVGGVDYVNIVTQTDEING